MEVWTAVCVAAAALYGFTVGRKLKEVCDGGFRADITLVVLLAVAVVNGCWAFRSFSDSPARCVGLLVSCSLPLLCCDWWKEALLPGATRAVLVTGCDSGFGHALARRLSNMGVKVFAGVLDVNGVGARQLRERRSENLQLLQLDVTDSSQVEAVQQYVQSQVASTGLWGLVNNAGVLDCPADAELQPLATYRRCMDINFLSAVNMCRVFLPLLRQSKGRIVNVSSMASEVPLPMFAAYGASKAALSVFSRVMRLELAEWGVQVSLIQPAGFRTDIFGNKETIIHYKERLLAAVSSEAREDYGEAYISSLPDSLSVMSQQSSADVSPVVEDMCHALLSTHPSPLYTPGRMGWLLPFLHRCCPTTVFDAIVACLPKHTDQRPAGLRRT